MTHSRIIAADGTIYIPEGSARRRLRRWVIAFLALLISPFLAAALAGVIMGAMGAYHTATASTPTLSPRLTAAIKVCAQAPADLRDDCIALALRRPFDNGKISDPKGTALADECLDDTSLTRDELLACFTQPAN